MGRAGAWAKSCVADRDGALVPATMAVVPLLPPDHRRVNPSLARVHTPAGSLRAGRCPTFTQPGRYARQLLLEMREPRGAAIAREGLECLEEAGYRAPSIRPTTIGPLGLLRSGDSFPGSDGPRRGLRGRTWAEAKVEPYIELVLTVRPYAGQPEQPGGGVQGCQRIALEVGPSFPT